MYRATLKRNAVETIAVKGMKKDSREKERKREEKNAI